MDDLWLIAGLAGQALFSARFLIQWVVSEKKKVSVIPHCFWYFSLGGAAILLSYAVHKRDPVFILGQSLGFLVYVRNLVLLRHSKKRRIELAEPRYAQAVR